MEREVRMRVLMDEYARLLQLFDDILSMRQSMARLEVYMLVMVAQVSLALLGGSLVFLCHLACRCRQRGEYRLEHRFEREALRIPSPDKKHIPP